MELTPEEIRVLGVLIEKEATTPDQYPLSTNALTNGCNQKTSRDPVVDYDHRTVSETMLLLRPAGLARTVISGRTEKHRHVVHEAWGLDAAQLAVLAVLMLRGPQSPGELRTRTERAHGFESLEDVDAVLQSLTESQGGLVRNIGRGPGQSQDRWIHLLGSVAAESAPNLGAARAPSGGAHLSEPTAAVAAPETGLAPASPANDQLEARVAALEARIALLERELGL